VVTFVVAVVVVVVHSVYTYCRMLLTLLRSVVTFISNTYYSMGPVAQSL